MKIIREQQSYSLIQFSGRVKLEVRHKPPN